MCRAHQQVGQRLVFQERFDSNGVGRPQLCEEIVYGVMFRKPIDRIISHINELTHYLHFEAAQPDKRLVGRLVDVIRCPDDGAAPTPSTSTTQWRNSTQRNATRRRVGRRRRAPVRPEHLWCFVQLRAIVLAAQCSVRTPSRLISRYPRRGQPRRGNRRGAIVLVGPPARESARISRSLTTST